MVEIISGVLSMLHLKVFTSNVGKYSSIYPD